MGSLTKLVQLGCAAAAAVILTGCTPQYIDKTDNSFRDALIGVKDHWLDYCGTLPTRPGDSVGDMQEDFNILAGIAANCAADKRALVEYLLPYVQKAKSTRK